MTDGAAALDMLHVVRLALPRLPLLLAGEKARTRIEALAAGLPFIAAGGFECRLRPGDDAVDFHVSLRPPRDEFRKRDPHPAWRLVTEVSANEPHSPFHKLIEEIILEFDLHHDVRGDEVPSIFLSLDPDAGHDAGVIRAVVRAIDPEADERLTRLLAVLPERARIAQIGVMYRGDRPVIRVNVANLTARAALGVLRHLAPDVVAAAAQALPPLEDLIDWIQLAVDLSDEKARKADVECFLAAQPPYEPRWRAFIDMLVARDACDHDKGRALLEWPGIIQRQDAATWPPALENLERFMSSVASSAFVFRINHIKMSIDCDGAIGAKGYPSFTHQWVNR